MPTSHPDGSAWPADPLATPPRLSRRHLLGLLVPLGVGVLAACAGTNSSPGSMAQSSDLRSSPTTQATSLLARPDRDEWPALFSRARPEAQEAYRYALAHHDVLQYIPCYCGCGVDGSGHTSNWDCYVAEVRPDGAFLLDSMSMG